jgi:hypothetical protein
MSVILSPMCRVSSKLNVFQVEQLQISFNSYSSTLIYELLFQVIMFVTV